MPDLSSAKDSIFSKKHSLNIGGKLMSLEQPKVMGILNLTPDSFYDGGKFNNTKNAIEQCANMLSDGADIIDIGASSSRPGATALSASEEIERLHKPLIEIRKEFPEAVISIDTYHAEVAKATAGLGANIINDISGGKLDSKMAKTIADIKLPIVLMHMQNTPSTMQKKPSYQNVYTEVSYQLSEQTKVFLDAGVNDIILDPGFGFGKSVEHNYQLLQSLDQFQLFERPLLVGFSRKSMINKLLDINPNEALNATSILNTMALMKGANIIRVHDVKEAKEAVKIVTFAQTQA